MKRHLFRRMGRFLRPQAPSLAGAAALAALSGLLALLVPLVAGWAVEAIGPQVSEPLSCPLFAATAPPPPWCGWGRPYPTHCGRQLFSKSLSYRSGILTPTRRGI